MRGPLSVTLAGVHMIRTATDVVVPTRPIFLMANIIVAKT